MQVPDHISVRRGFTLIELLIVIAIIAILLGLLLCAVMKVREAAHVLDSQNNMRQIIMGFHHFATTQQGRLPSVDDRAPSLFRRILPYLEQGAIERQLQTKPTTAPTFALFISPADPTASEGVAAAHGLSSYAANARVFRDIPHLPHTIPDGTSNTIALAEHYAFRCKLMSFYYWYNTSGSVSHHQATFADDRCYDATPNADGNPPISRSSHDYAPTFQVAPSRANCNPMLAQTPHRGGMIVALADGSVRTLHPGMSPATYWGAVTPAGGEMPGSDW